MTAIRNTLDDFNFAINLRMDIQLKKNFSYKQLSINPTSEEDQNIQIDQKTLFSEDLRRHFFNFIKYSKYELTSLAQIIGTLALVPFAIFIDIYKACTQKSFSAVNILKNLYLIPQYILISTVKLGHLVVRVVDKLVDCISVGIGYLAWHGGEFIVRQIKSCFSKDKPNENSILSTSAILRDKVYQTIGITLIAGLVFFCCPILSIQMVALPIIAGSFFSLIHEMLHANVFVKEINQPKKNIKTDVVFFRVLANHCSDVLKIAKLVGIVLAAVGTIPFAPFALPITLAAAMLGIVGLVAVVAARIYSNMHKRKIEYSIEQYAKEIGIKLTEDDKLLTRGAFRLKYLKQINLAREANRDKMDALERRILEGRCDCSLKHLGCQELAKGDDVLQKCLQVGSAAMLISVVFIRIFAL